MSTVSDRLRGIWQRAGRALSARRLAAAGSGPACHSSDDRGAAAAASPAAEDEHREILDRERHLRVLMSNWM